ncbi:hypothetical protein F4860DRAFT_121211 [Xylaria cubensis]|nr:hypothetical protein F4860DRAFT_121211 [Xylaria cubensis]
MPSGSRNGRVLACMFIALSFTRLMVPTCTLTPQTRYQKRHVPLMPDINNLQTLLPCDYPGGRLQLLVTSETAVGQFSNPWHESRSII